MEDLTLREAFVLGIIPLISGLILASITWLVTSMYYKFYKRPKIEVEFDPSSPGCITQTQFNNHQGAKFIRIGVKNTGNQLAENVEVRVSGVWKQDESSQFHRIIFDPLCLRWAYSHEARTALNPRLPLQYVDLLHIRQDNRYIQPCFIVGTPNNLIEKLTKGKFIFSVSIFCTNGSPAIINLLIRWNEEFPDLTAEVYAGKLPS